MITIEERKAERDQAMDEMIGKIGILLGNQLVDCEIDNETIKSCIDVAIGKWKRRFHSTIADWYRSPNVVSWVTEYALANCKLILGEARAKLNPEWTPNNGEVLVVVALERINALENEIKGN